MPSRTSSADVSPHCAATGGLSSSLALQRPSSHLALVLPMQLQMRCRWRRCRSWRARTMARVACGTDRHTSGCPCTPCRYPDYTLTPSGLQYIDLREGSGKQPQQGATVLIDWGGYTIGYYGRPFEARNKVLRLHHVACTHVTHPHTSSHIVTAQGFCLCQ